MNVKKVLYAVLLFPIFAVVMIFADKYIIDIIVSIVAIMCLHEFYKAFRKKAKPIEWVGYIAALAIAIIHIIPSNIVLPIIAAIIPISMLILFLNIILTNMKYNINDIAITFFGICYVVLFLVFAPIIRENIPNGKILIWFVFFISWGTDIFAWLIGSGFGKHKFTKVSPNKSVEGCIGGICGGILVTLIYTVICNNLFSTNMNYSYVVVISILLSIISQIGDLAASSIKRYCEIKDYSNLIPGHGGALDRLDSVIFALPFAYFLLTLL